MRQVERAFVILTSAAVIAALVLMTVVVGWNVGLRYLSNRSLPWADELARYTMIWMTFLGAGLALREGVHVAISNLQDALPGPVQRGLRWIILIGLMSFFAFMIWVGLDYMSRSAFQRSAALRLPMKWVYAAMPVGFALLLVHLAFIAPRYLRAGFSNSEDDAARG